MRIIQRRWLSMTSYDKFLFLLPVFIILSFLSNSYAISANCGKAIELYNRSISVDDFFDIACYSADQSDVGTFQYSAHDIAYSSANNFPNPPSGKELQSLIQWHILKRKLLPCDFTTFFDIDNHYTVTWIKDGGHARLKYGYGHSLHQSEPIGNVQIVHRARMILMIITSAGGS